MRRMYVNFKLYSELKSNNIVLENRKIRKWFGSSHLFKNPQLKLESSSPKLRSNKLLEEEKSTDFVFIPPEEKEAKERILTEHQKEVLKTKRFVGIFILTSLSFLSGTKIMYHCVRYLFWDVLDTLLRTLVMVGKCSPTRPHLARAY